jgi:hypothetical protein
LKAELIDPINDPRWIEFLNSREDATIFHHPAWLKVLGTQYGYDTMCACIFENGRIQSGIIFCAVKGISLKKKLVSVPFTDHFEPLVKNTSHLEALTSYLKAG